MTNVVIVSAVRTPIGSFQGALSTVPAPRLGAAAIKESLSRVSVSPNDVDECIMGEVLTAGVGQAPARQAAIYAGLPESVRCMTINKVCGSGLKAVMLGADAIRLGHAQVVVAGGMENMSQAPHLLQGSRDGFRMGPASLIDSMIRDGLWDPYNDWHMGNAAELCVKEKSFDREGQDAFAKESYEKAQKAQASGLLKDEIVAVEIASKKETLVVDTDEEPGRARFDKMASLRPAFDKDGTITAANASKINDGAAATVLMSEENAKKRGLTPLAKIVSYETFAHDPKYFTTAPLGAIKKALEKAELNVNDIDLWEINEAFAVVTQVAAKELEIPLERVNVRGGAIAYGHPIGASGARVLTTLVHTMKQTGKKLGLATLCIGGGEAVAMIVENPNG